MKSQFQNTVYNLSTPIKTTASRRLKLGLGVLVLGPPEPSESARQTGINTPQRIHSIDVPD
jgi:hypothetical protein